MADGFRLLQEAEKALAGASGGFSFFSNKESKMQDAADKFTSAAHAFRTAKKYGEAAQAFERTAYVHGGDGNNKMLNEPDDAARNYDEASKQYRLAGMPEEAKRTLHKAADYWYAKGNVTRAGQARGSLGEWLATQAGDNMGALEEFVTAADYYMEDQKPALASKWRVKAAEMSALTGNFPQAAQWYGMLAEEALQNATMKYSAKNYLFNACLCSLALNDEVTAKRAVTKAAEMDPMFATQPHNRLINDLIEAMFVNQDPGEFAARLQEFERGTGSKFDNYQVAGLLAAKRAIVEADNEFA
ncbi:hypothetical protein MKZ38_009783 [Zalerion maritima]|uniref:Uncharacterized protein n=1 Tax=Zalerion maritima TaxID=339359 RepID=A0AAD5WXW2_9PEZI|nr:hypothetical protein MKZ38_009783 [Zalerion maritima]